MILVKEKKFEPRQLKDKFAAKLLTKYPILFNKWAKKADILEFRDSPWMPFAGDTVRSRIALITTGGVHLLSQQPFNMKDPSGDPSFREIPADTPPDNLSITHIYYDHTDADKDINIVFPIERIRLLRQFGEIGSVNPRHFSFMGHISGQHIDTLINETAPRVANKLKEDNVDVTILTPA
ncbi:MAG: glycine/sarcosine/betaine reductase selenoprotein B family protein [Planctomycetota bacterium]|jgi:D-proline reductase (dithiol) PrdB